MRTNNLPILSAKPEAIESLSIKDSPQKALSWIILNIWGKVFKNRTSKLFRRLSSTNLTWFIPKYFVPYYDITFHWDCDLTILMQSSIFLLKYYNKGGEGKRAGYFKWSIQGSISNYCAQKSLLFKLMYNLSIYFLSFPLLLLSPVFWTLVGFWCSLLDQFALLPSCSRIGPDIAGNLHF